MHKKYRFEKNRLEVLLGCYVYHHNSRLYLRFENEKSVAVDAGSTLLVFFVGIKNEA